MTRVLEGVITSGTGAGYTYMGCPSEAGKTGTSEGLSDAWFVGYTPLYSTAVWVGHPTNRAKKPASAGRPRGRSGSPSCLRRRAATAPNSRCPRACPNCTRSRASHTRSSNEVAPKNEEFEEERRRKVQEGRRKGKGIRRRRRRRRERTARSSRTEPAAGHAAPADPRAAVQHGRRRRHRRAPLRAGPLRGSSGRPIEAFVAVAGLI